MTEMPIGPFYRGAKMEKRALGFTTERVISEELPLYRDAKTFFDNLFKLWVFQKAPDGTDFAVTESDWNRVKDAEKKRWPKQAKLIGSYPWMGSAGQRKAVELGLDDPPVGGVR